MADYIKRTTTNYFEVTAEEDLRKLISQIDCEGKIDIIPYSKDSKTFYKLYAYGSLDGVDGCYNDKELYEEFQKILPDNEVLEIYPISYEDNSHDLSSGVIIITNKGYTEKSTGEIAEELANEVK